MKPITGIHINFSPAEQKALEDFFHEHSCFQRSPNYILDHFKFMIGYCEIGNTITVICRYCGEKKEITDYDSW